MRIKASARTALAINLVIVAVGSSLMIYNWYASRRAAAKAAANAGGPQLHAPATVTSVAQLPAAQNVPSSSAQMRVCFTIDSFAAIPSRDRSFYETMERDRQAAHGPRCQSEPAQMFADSLHPGDRMNVNFVLENGGTITVKELTAPEKDFPRN